jgi:hypothetical protein
LLVLKTIEGGELDSCAMLLLPVDGGEIATRGYRDMSNQPMGSLIRQPLIRIRSGQPAA